MINLNEMARDALATAKKREKKGQLKTDTTSILKHCAGEVCEAVEDFRDYCVAIQLGLKSERINLPKEDFSDALADIITCALIAAANEDVDIEAALLRVQEMNARRAEQ